LQKRTDDTLDIAINRYQTYETKIASVINFYKQSNLLKVVNGEAPISEINDEISGLMESIKG
jgi:adenylate kinase family enzyme